jgi:hypothetical protein
MCIGLNRIFRDRILGSDKSLLLHIIIIRIEWDRRMLLLLDSMNIVSNKT